MPRYERIDWYETPGWYDLVFEEDTEKEADFLEEAVRRYGRARARGGARRVLEPACGSGRLAAEMARRGWCVSGFDASPAMLEHARRKLRRARLEADLRVGRLESFRYRERFDLAHCLVSTFKYLLDERSAREHLRCVARSLRRGGLYVLGLHLSDYDWPFPDHERWTASRDGVEVVCNIHTWPAQPVRRLERVRSRLVVRGHGRVRRTETHWQFRTYDAAELLRLLRAAPALDHVATYDFHYDWTRPRPRDDRQRDAVLILRRR
jgi:SAM-dependent methyltransferase